jgi:DNA-binding CsgD family transcriptional regulator
MSANVSSKSDIGSDFLMPAATLRPARWNGHLAADTGSEILTQAARQFGHAVGLSGREQEILELAAQGLVDKEISARLGLAYTTVKSYWARICLKTAVRNRHLAIGKLLADLAARASRPSSIWP